MSILWAIASAAALLMALGWWWQERHRDAGIVDVLWALGMAGAAAAVAAAGEGDARLRLLVGAAGGVWGLRLGLHLLRDRVIGKPEDGRYQAMRAWMGRRASLGFFVFFQAQTAAVVLCVLPLAIVADLPWVGWGWCAAAMGLFALSLGGCTLADRQLARFRAAGSGGVCRDGLWRYSRHPNYFFEWLQWIGWGMLCALHPAWWGWLGTAMIAVMYLLLTRITGIPHVERRCLAHRGEAYARYQRTTNAFFPWFPRPEPRP